MMLTTFADKAIGAKSLKPRKEKLSLPANEANASPPDWFRRSACVRTTLPAAEVRRIRRRPMSQNARRHFVIVHLF